MHCYFVSNFAVFIYFGTYVQCDIGLTSYVTVDKRFNSFAIVYNVYMMIFNRW